MTLELDRVCVARRKTPLLRDISLRARPGAVSVVVGANGAGKSSLLAGISGMLSITAGRATLDGTDIARKPRWRRARMGLCHVEQGRAVFGELTARENISVVSADPAALRRCLELFPELESRLSTKAALLSGGEQQMVALGRALACRPKVLIVDELSLGLAPAVVVRLLGALRALADEGLAVLAVEQFAHAALEHADEAYVLYGGTMTYAGDAKTLRDDPALLHAAYVGEPHAAGEHGIS